MIDPFEEHPAHPPTEKKTLETLTTDFIFDTIKQEINRIDSLESPLWGFSKRHLFSVAENIRYKIERFILDAEND